MIAEFKYSKAVLIVIVSVGFLVSSQSPAWACPSQSNGTANEAQKTDDSLPDAPQAQSGQESTQSPTGAAGAKAAPVKGAPAAKPVGAAVAPVRQRGHRSLLIKLGLIAGAGIAVGTVVALSERSPSRPPGTTPASH